MTASPKGQCSDTMRNLPPRFSAWAAKPCAVSASATAWSASLERTLDVGGVVERTRHHAPVLDAYVFGHALGVFSRQHRQGSAEQRDEHVVAPQRCLEGQRRWRARTRAHDPIALGRPAGTRSGGASGTDLDVATGSKLVEVMAGDIGMQLEVFGRLGGRDAFGTIVGKEVDLPPGRIAECGADSGDCAREIGTRRLRWRLGVGFPEAWSALHIGILPIGIGEIPLTFWPALRGARACP